MCICQNLKNIPLYSEDHEQSSSTKVINPRRLHQVYLGPYDSSTKDYNPLSLDNFNFLQPNTNLLLCWHHVIWNKENLSTQEKIYNKDKLGNLHNI